MEIHSWQSFFMIMGSAAGALTGLMFVVIALRRDQMAAVPVHGRRSFATPTIVHFMTVLAISALLSMPGLSAHAVGWILIAIAASSCSYMAFIIDTARRRFDYNSDLEDTLFHFTFPPLAHLTILLAGVLAFSEPGWTLYMVAVSQLTLLVVAIHNAWDSATWFVVRS